MNPLATVPAFQAETLRRGIEERDVAALLSLYTEDAELRMIDRTSPPSTPRVLCGREEIGAMLYDVCSREMTHTLDRLVVQGDTAAYMESCRYPDGTRVLYSGMLDLVDGRITRQTGVQAWDE
jgi:ketosteroid isomerase-like protein